MYTDTRLAQKCLAKLACTRNLATAPHTSRQRPIHGKPHNDHPGKQQPANLPDDGTPVLSRHTLGFGSIILLETR